ncbi:EVE domain-containing protein [Saccharospirillum sp. MSK14-1]|uniref:EVE domain-containing protein n=1 Tax=Saccharospirillum sp. MSK14-1 TaxID=1897632 RepID=UPI000D3906C0|nr:EVE domain-containing protein [Saccharospirillum sp. MSK14-1]PTY37467.1 EVE domain-containing protein [Saccharospirillum sp. MSK14-1]
MANWLAKTEPDEFSLDDLEARGKAGEPWNGIRNYQARNHLRAMVPGDRVLIYHSACAEPAVVGEAEVISEPRPDPDALDPASRYYDPKSSADNPRWTVITVAFRQRWPKPVPLKLIKQTPELAEMALLRQSRLSVSPVTDEQWLVLEQLSVQ